MPHKPVSDNLLQQALDVVEEYGSEHLAILANSSLPPRTTLMDRAKLARLKGMRPTFKKDAPRIYTRKRIGKMHIVIPDVQMKAGVRSDHLEWVGNYIAEKQPDTIVCIGDFWDMPSLSSHDKGQLAFEGRRYVKDVQAGRAAMERLLNPIRNVSDYKPRMVFTCGNHEVRIQRVVNLNPEFSEKFSIDDLGIKDYGWEFHPFLKVVEIDGIEYSHYFTSGVMGRPASSAAVVLRERQKSATMGHVQHTDIAMHKRTQQIALFCGTCYLHDEDYLGHQGNNQRRQIVVKHEVEEGRYDPMFVSLKFLEKAYS